MKELIPSKDVRDYLKESKHRFTDSEKATLIYNSEWSLPDKHKALLEITDLTEDAKLKEQIRERIECDKHCLLQIKSSAGDFVYKWKCGKRRMTSIMIAEYLHLIIWRKIMP